MLVPFLLVARKWKAEVIAQRQARSRNPLPHFPQYQPDRPSYSNISLQRNCAEETPRLALCRCGHPARVQSWPIAPGTFYISSEMHCDDDGH